MKGGVGVGALYPGYINVCLKRCLHCHFVHVSYIHVFRAVAVFQQVPLCGGLAVRKGRLEGAL
jgi:hypothetical protein